MNLKYIKTTQCPICGCKDVVKEYVETNNYLRPEIRQHCDGGRREHREFLCGYEIRYDPNFLKEIKVKDSECFYDKEVIERKEKEKRDKEMIITLLRNNNISPKIIDKVRAYCL